MKVNTNKKTKYSIINLIITSLYQFASIIFGLIVPRLILKEYSSEIHGLTSTITNIMAYVQLINAGLSIAAVQAMYIPLGEQNKERINSVLNAIGKFYRKTGICYIIVIFTIAFIMPHFMEESIPSATITLLMITMGLTNIIECFTYSKYRALLLADQRIYIVNIVGFLALIIKGIIQVVLVNNNASILLVQFTPVLTLILSILILRIYVNKKYIFLNKTVSADMKALSKRKSAFANQIAGLVVNNTDILLLTFIIKDLNLVSIYAVYNLVFTHLYSLMTNILQQSTIGAFGQLMASENKNRVIENYKKYEFIYYYIFSIVISVTTVMLIPFVRIYTMGVENLNYIDYKLVLLFLIIAILNHSRVPAITIISAGGYYKENQWSCIAEAVINLIVSLLLIKKIGIYGILIGTIISYIYRSLQMNIFVNIKILKRGLKETYFRILRIILIVICTLIFSVGYISIDYKNWSEWIIYSILVFVISGTIATILSIICDKKIIKDIYRKINVLFASKKKGIVS